MKKIIEKHLEGEITLREVARLLNLDLESSISEISRAGMYRDRDLSEFDRKQFDYIVRKIATKIEERIGTEKVLGTINELKDKKISISEAIKKLQIHPGDFILLLQKHRVYSDKEFREKVREILKNAGKEDF